MVQQEQMLYDSWKILQLEQEKEELRREYIDRIAAINLEIFQLQNRISNVTTTRTAFEQEFKWRL